MNKCTLLSLIATMLLFFAGNQAAASELVCSIDDTKGNIKEFSPPYSVDPLLVFRSQAPYGRATLDINTADFSGSFYRGKGQMNAIRCFDRAFLDIGYGLEWPECDSDDGIAFTISEYSQRFGVQQVESLVLYPGDRFELVCHGYACQSYSSEAPFYVSTGGGGMKTSCEVFE